MAERRKLIAPYVEWAVATDFAYLPGVWFRVLLELETSAAGFAFDIERDDRGLRDLIRVPSIYQTPSREFKKDDGKICMAIMTKEALIALVAGEGHKDTLSRLQPIKEALKRIDLGTPAGEPFEPSPVAAIDKPLAITPARNAIVAVIDDGLAFAHERFRFADGTSRFKYFWNQDPETNIAPGFGWGHELTQPQINHLLSSCTDSGIVNEEGVYRRAAQNLVARRAKHGTHVMDIACGLDPKEVTASSPYLIGVQLPKWVTEETSGASLTPLVHAAIAYILDRADRIAADEDTGPLPVVINLSYGTIAGPHDGTGQLEAEIDRWIATRAAPLSIVLPAGNHYLARCHASFKLRASEASSAPVKQLHWRVQPDDKSCSFAEIWLPKFAQHHTRPKVALRITTPTGASSRWILPGGSWLFSLANSVRFQADYYDLPGDRPWIKLAMSPTAEMTENPRTAPSGSWLIELRNDGGEIEVEAWVQRGDTPFGYPLSGRQSRFDDKEYKRFDLAGRPRQDDSGPSCIHRRGTLNALATGKFATVIGGFRHSDRAASEYSGSGPAATPLVGPDAVAIADDSVAMRGVLASGTRSGSVVAMNGTSVAAPQVTRWISKQMTNHLPSERMDVQAFAKANDPMAPAPGSALKERLGTGRIDGPEPEPLGFRWKRW